MHDCIVLGRLNTNRPTLYCYTYVMTFSEKVLEYIQPGSHVLDLGAGNGWFSRQAADRQAKVTAVDLVAPNKESQEIDWQAMSVQEFVERWPKDQEYDLIFSRNLIQFLDATWTEHMFIPALIQHLRSGGIIAIQTFFRDPEPSFERSLSSLYTVTDLRKLLDPLTIVDNAEFSDQSKDMKGIPRTFFITNIIAKKIE